MNDIISTLSLVGLILLIDIGTVLFSAIYIPYAIDKSS